MEQQAQTGDTVRVQYTAKLEDGRIFAASKADEGVSFTLGKGEVIPGLEKAVLGMKPGQTKTADVPPQDGFGMRDDNRLITVETNQIPEGIEAKPGVRLSLQHPNGNVETVVIADVQNERVVLDANHPLAGRELKLEVTLLDIN